MTRTRHYLLYGSAGYAAGILRPVQAAIRARADDAAWFFGGPGAEVLRPDERLLRTVAEVKAWNPVAVLTPSNAVPDFFPGVKVEVFHGFDAGKPRHIHIRGFFDLYCTTGPADTQAFKDLAARLGHFTVRETGWPKLDPFLGQLGDSPPPVQDPPVVLYHSTFSPSLSAADVLYDEVARMSRTGRWRWIVTLHPKMNPGTVARFEALESDHLRFSRDDNILNEFMTADVMVSDTSSALSEFLLTYKPVVTFRNRRPGPQLIDISDPAKLEESIELALSRPPSLMRAVREYADSIHPQRDGRSSERVLAAVDEFVAGGGRNPRNKPLNLWRRLRMRRKLGYWHWR
jgi:CDP-glycerol glycerophosphotransferase (TagB/SpsB family)